MPTQLEAKLKAEAAAKFPIPGDASDEERQRIEARRNVYVFGTLRKTGWRPRR